MEPKTDREILIQMNSKVDNFAESLERIANSLERLETVKFEAHDKRIARLEKFQNQLFGGLAFLASFDIIMNLVKMLGGK